MSEPYTFHDDDVIAPGVYGRDGHPHRAFAWLRANDPLRLVRPTDFRPFWVVTKHADVIEIEKQPQIFERLQDSPMLLEVLATAEGDTLGLFYASANFDEDVFDGSFTFRIDRKPNRHPAFGTGPHQCQGLLLARLEMRIFFTQLMRRLEYVEPTAEPSHLCASFVHGLKHLPVRLRLKAA